MATHDFIGALAASGGCERLTLFVPAHADVALLERTLVASFDEAAAARVAVVPYARVAGHLADIDVMHMLDPNLWLAGHLRSQLASRPFAITGVTHSLANQHFLQWMLLNDANGICAQDCLVCTTPTARAVVESAAARLREMRPAFAAPTTTVIPLGIASAGGAPLPGESRARLGWGADEFVVLSLARFNAQFKMDLVPVLRLAARVREEARRRVRFVLAGAADDGSYARLVGQQALELGVSDITTLVTDPDDAAKSALLASADAFLSLSDNIQETFGLAVVEAMAAGLPVVASDWDGYRSLVADGETGFLVRTCTLAPDAAWEAALALRYDALVHLFCAQTTAVDLDAACAALLRLAADPDLRVHMASCARERAATFAWPAIIGRYLELWQNLCATSRTASSDSPARSSALRFCEDFRTYSTAQLGPHDRFGLTESGRQLAGGAGAVRFYRETEEFLDVRLMGLALALFAGGRSLSDVRSRLAACGTDCACLEHNVLWLYKNGFLRALDG